MAAPLQTTHLELPANILGTFIDQIKHGSCVATLSAQKPQKFGVHELWSFDIGEAEYVGEGAAKGPSNITVVKRQINPFKFHKTIRVSEEILWADEDTQLQVVQDVTSQIQPALSRALDFGVFHAVNPATGAAVAAMPAPLSATTIAVTRGTGPAFTELDAADSLILAKRYTPSGIALDPAWATVFAGQRVPQTGQKLYPDFHLQTAPTSNLDNHKASVSDTVSAARVIEGGTGVIGFVGDFDKIVWGVQRQIGLKRIEYGNPDGLGDLQRQNEVAIRAEVVFGWAIVSPDAFCKILAAPAPDQE
ncbi:MAG: phage major capsid protein [Propionibacteriaceae bacterium]|jgi:hypothetical protein|nr:phage major capsid protein [Propionibacteriaceae bacterium]